jgi:anti-sigma factor RsiW
MTHQEINELLTDYTLGLLAPKEAKEVAQHLAGCTTCRQEIYREREIRAMVRETLNMTTRSNPAQLRQFMPPIPQEKHSNRFTTAWASRLAPALVLVGIIIGSFLMTAPESRRSMSIFFSATATATSTNTPTATIVQNIPNNSSEKSTITAGRQNDLPAREIEPAIQAVTTPAPLPSPTPITDIISTTTN